MNQTQLNTMTFNKRLIVFILFLLSHPAIATTTTTTTTTTAPFSDSVTKLESRYIADCETNHNPHGYYGAFFQPCEFSFYENHDVDDPTGKKNFCSSKSAVLLGTPKPVHWIFKLQNYFDKNNWNELSSDDMPDVDDLMLWPDQCVGVGPRCYSISSSDNHTFSDVLDRLFPDDGIPIGATHVEVDCRADAMELSRVSYAFASGLEKNVAYIVYGFVALCLTVILVLSLCFYGCFRLCFRPNEAKQKYVSAYYAVPAEVRVDEYHHATTGLVDSEHEFELSKTKAKYDAV